tara:strand:- start:1017 stop:2768 length:1752 start_codon:yes stop_codon:yes gene_type:complete
MNSKKLGITEVVLRDGHQSLLATRMRIEDMEPILTKIDEIGYWSIESWGGATFDACIRYLGEDPWERIRILKKAMPKTPQQMLLRGQNILGYRHYADDLVKRFVDTSIKNGVDVFRVFDAMNDIRNLETALKAVIDGEKHAQGTISYTVSPVHNLDYWLDLSLKLQDIGAHSIAIKDMAGLLKPFTAFELVSRLKESLEIPIHMQSHATTGMSTATAVKAIEAGIDNVDTSISSMSMTYGHSPTESLVAILSDTSRSTELDLNQLDEISSYFRKVRSKYSKFEGSLRGVDSRILVAQVPGGMLTNMENQLKEQNALDRFDEVLQEIPKVREDLGLIPLVTPTSQIVGSQSVLNVLSGERYKSISKETSSLLAGEYGETPAPVNEEVRKLALGDTKPITVRPADLIDNEMEKIRNELEEKIKQGSLDANSSKDEDVLTYALFPQVAIKFFANRTNSDFFEPAPLEIKEQKPGIYNVIVDKQEFIVRVEEGKSSIISSSGEIKEVEEKDQPVIEGGTPLLSPLSGTVHKVCKNEGESVKEGDVLLILEAMKMETEIQSVKSGIVSQVQVIEGDSVKVDQQLMLIQ